MIIYRLEIYFLFNYEKYYQRQVPVFYLWEKNTAPTKSGTKGKITLHVCSIASL